MYVTKPPNGYDDRTSSDSLVKKILLHSFSRRWMSKSSKKRRSSRAVCVHACEKFRVARPHSNKDRSIQAIPNERRRDLERMAWFLDAVSTVFKKHVILTTVMRFCRSLVQHSNEIDSVWGPWNFARRDPSFVSESGDIEISRMKKRGGEPYFHVHGFSFTFVLWNHTHTDTHTNCHDMEDDTTTHRDPRTLAHN